MTNFSYFSLIVILTLGFVTESNAQNKKPFSQLGFDKSPSDSAKTRPAPVDKVTEILRAFSKTDETPKSNETINSVDANPPPTPTPAPSRRRKPLSQID